MQHADLIIDARWIVPVVPRDNVLEHASLVVEQGRIVAIGSQSEIHTAWQGKAHICREDHVLIPGLVNAHTHAAMSLLRGLADDRPLMDWLENHIWPAEGQHVNAAFCRDGVELAIAEMLRGGTTCFNDMYFYPDVTAEVAAGIGMRAVVGMIMIDFPSAWAQNPDEYLSKGTAVRDAWRDHPLISTVFAPHAPYTVSDGPLQKIRMLADEMDLPVHIHLHETAFEVSQAEDQDGRRPIRRLQELGLLNPNLLAVHMTQLTDADIALAAKTGIHVLHCPESNLKLASGFCPVAKLLKAGVNVALGTDGAASNNDLDMLGEARSAALLAKAVANDAAALPAAQALEIATMGGAKALHLADQIGSLEVGKWADLTCVNLSSVATQPVYDPVSTLIYAASRDQVSDVWVAGQPQLSAGQLTRIDQADVLAKAKSWQERIRIPSAS